MVGQPLATYSSQHWDEAKHKHLNNMASELSFPCLCAIALQRAGVKAGIQARGEENWIPACEGMADKRTKMDKADLKSTYYFTPFAFKVKVV